MKDICTDIEQCEGFSLPFNIDSEVSLQDFELPSRDPIKEDITLNFKPESLFLEKFDSSPQKWIVMGGDKYKTLKKRQRKRANKTKMSHRKRKRMYVKPFKYVLDGFVNTITMNGNTATIIIKGE